MWRRFRSSSRRRRSCYWSRMESCRLMTTGTKIFRSSRNLLHHTSGVRDQWDLLELSGWRYSLDLITNEDVMSVVVRQKALNFAPGSEYSYSNTGFTLLGETVKRVSGKSLRE